MNQNNISLENIIKGLECCLSASLGETICPTCTYRYDENGIETGDCEINLLKDAIELLKMQEPVKPVLDIDTWKCGNCGHTLEHQELLGDNVLFHEQYNYCPECGKPVKWE